MSKEYERVLKEVTCDMCGEKSKADNSDHLSRWQELEYQRCSFDGHRNEYSDYCADLCPKCASKVGAWIEENAKRIAE